MAKENLIKKEEEQLTPTFKVISTQEYNQDNNQETNMIYLQAPVQTGDASCNIAIEG